MWKKIVIENKDFMIRNSFAENKYEVILTDFNNVWLESLTEEQLLERCKVSL